LTINGAEYEALKGMQNLLERSKDISMVVVAGRKGTSLGEYEGKPDKIVIKDYLEKFGFKTRFVVLGDKSMGYVMARKGKAKFFMRANYLGL
jgi:hypothetical protein